MKFLVALAVMISGQVFASNCINQIKESFLNVNPRFYVLNVKFKGVLKPGEERLFFDSEIVNNSQTPRDIYEIESAFMAGFVHIALVNKSNCKMTSLTEVFFE